MKFLTKVVDFLAHVTLFTDRSQQPLSYSSSDNALGAATNLDVAVSPAPSNGGCVHGPKDRGCWTDGFGIQTDYELHWPDTGNVRNVRLQDCSGLYSAQRCSIP